ncbi:tetratricopeptide repeat protein [Methylocaldum szegediense]|nr:tetratricopeptide repeat protein [Methylocaldum szegediense]
MKFSRSQTQRAMLRKNAHRLVCILALSAFSEASFSASAPWVGETLNKTVCQGKGQGYGPFDYTSPTDRKHLGIVEHYHFTSDVEHLRKGASGSIALDLDYTLRAFPNHHRALNAMMTFQLQKHIYNQRHSDIPPPECYFQRAINFAPNDVNVYILYGIYLHKRGLKEHALAQYQKALKIKPQDPELNYNIGLLLVELKRPDEALSHAKIAYQNGYPLPGLKTKLKHLGKWTD